MVSTLSCHAALSIVVMVYVLFVCSLFMFCVQQISYQVTILCLSIRSHAETLVIYTGNIRVVYLFITLMASTIFLLLFFIDLYECDEWWICPIPMPSIFRSLSLFLSLLLSPENLNFIDFIKKARNNKRSWYCCMCVFAAYTQYIEWRIVNLLFNPDAEIPFNIFLSLSFYSTKCNTDRWRIVCVCCMYAIYWYYFKRFDNLEPFKAWKLL